MKTRMTWQEADELLPPLITIVFVCAVICLVWLLGYRGLSSSQAPYHELLARALWRGRLWIAEAPNPAKCPWDTTFFEGKCYLYWGILPALLHAVFPFFSDRFVTALSGGVTVFFFVKILLGIAASISEKEGPDLLGALPFLILPTYVTGIATTAMVGRVYEESIQTSLAFGFAAFYTVLPVILEGNWSVVSRRRIGIAGGLFAAAMLCRATWLLPSALLLGWLLIQLIRSRGGWSRAVLFAAPLVVAGLGQLWLNWFRYGDPFDTGASGVSTFATGLIKQFFRPDLWWSHAVTIFFTGLPPRVNPLFVPASLRDLSVYPTVTRFFFRDAWPEGAVALFVAAPSLLLGLTHVRKLAARGRKKLARVSAVTFTLCLPILLGPGLLFRYGTEATLFVLVVLVPTLVAAPVPESKWPRLSYLGVAWGAFGWGLSLHLVNSIWLVLSTKW